MESNTENRRWSIELDEDQMRLLINIVEDWHRFMSGQCEMDFASSFFDTNTMLKMRKILNEQVKPTIFPELHPNESYSWDGGHENSGLNKAQAMSYMLYREMRHQLTLANKIGSWNCYTSPTLTCEEQGPLIDVKLK